MNAKEILQAGLAASQARNPDHTPITEVPPMHCDQCEMVSINGLACHEHNCPNADSRWDTNTHEWVRQRDCFVCGCECDYDAPCCDEWED